MNGNEKSTHAIENTHLWGRGEGKRRGDKQLLFFVKAHFHTIFLEAPILLIFLTSCDITFSTI